MKTVVVLCCALISLGLPSAGPLSAAEFCYRDEALKAAFPEADAFEEKVVVMTEEQVEEVRKLTDSNNTSRIFRYTAVFKGDAVLGYATVDTVSSRNAPMTFMVAIGPDGAVKKVVILAHIESPGKAVQQRSFLSQFDGKSAGDSIRIGSDIDAVTGATQSSRATTEGVRRALARFSVVVPVTSAEDNGRKEVGGGERPNEEE